MLRRKAPCLVCGKTAEIEALCEEHWVEKQELFSLEPFTMESCDQCGRWKGLKGREWIKAGNLSESIIQAVKDHVKPAFDAKMSDITVTIRQLGENNPGIALVSAMVTGFIEPANTEVKRIVEIRVKIHWIKCDLCVQLNGRYHEAVLQLRGDAKESLVDIVKEVTSQMHYRVEEKKEGPNVLFVKKGDGNKVVKELKQRGFAIKRTSKLVGQKKDRRLYRDVYAVR